MTVVAPNAFRMERTVGPKDVDVQDRASNVAVVSWISAAAIAHSESLGWPHARYVELGGFFVVRRHEIDYLAAARLGDRVTVATWPSALEKASAERRTVVLDAAGRPLARAVSLWGFVDPASGRPRRIPPELARTFDPARFVRPGG